MKVSFISLGFRCAAFFSDIALAAYDSDVEIEEYFFGKIICYESQRAWGSSLNQSIPKL